MQDLFPYGTTLKEFFSEFLDRAPNGTYSNEFRNGISKSLAIANQNARSVLFNTSRRIKAMLNEFENIQATYNIETASFRNVIADSDFTIRSANLRNVAQEHNEMCGVMIRLAAIYANARRNNIMRDGGQKKFQVRFGTFTSNMYYISTTTEFVKALFDILVKYEEQLFWFKDEQYAVQGGLDEQRIRQNLDEIEISLQDGGLTINERQQLIERRETLQNELDILTEDLNIDEEYDENTINLTAECTFIRYLGLRGGRIPEGLVLPKQISRSVINPNYPDGFCFFNCLDVAKIYFSKKYDKFCYYADQDRNPELNEYGYDTEEVLEKFYDENQTFIFTPDNIKKIEEMFGYNISVYDLTCSFYGEYGIRCCYKSDFTVDDAERVVRILYVPYSMMSITPKITSKKRIADLKKQYGIDDEIDYNNKTDGHFCLIPDTSQLLCVEGGTEQNKTLYCPYCDHGFDAQNGDLSMFTQHKIHCKIMVNRRSNEDRLCIFNDNPADSTIQFKNWYQLTKQPWTVYADTETVTTDSEGNFQKHKIIAYMLNIVCSFDSSLSYQVMRSATTQEEQDNLIKQFANDIFQIRVYIKEHSQKFPLMKMSDREKFYNDYYNNPDSKTTCQFCKCQLDINLNHEYEDEFFEEMVKISANQNKIRENLLALKQKQKQKQKDKTIIITKEEKDACGEIANVSPHLHHCHNTGKIIGFLCQRCNKNERKSQKTVSVAFHNLPYDLLVLIESFAENTFDNITYKGKTYHNIKTENKLSVIANSGQKYSTISIHSEKVKIQNFTLSLPEVKYIDTFRFVTKSLASIVETLVDNEKNVDKLKKTFCHTWEYLEKQYGKKTAEALFPYSTQKGLIAYDHINLENLKSKDNLPIECYKNSLSLVNPTEENSRTARYEVAAEEEKVSLRKDYARTNEVYAVLKKHFGESMTYREYFNFYLELDIMLLTDYFEKLREQLIGSHNLDPAYHTGLAGYSQNCMLYHTGSILNLIESVEISKMIIDNTRGGYSGIMQRISENFFGDEKKILKLFDVNNLYGFSMCQKLANKYIAELSPEEFEIERENYDKDGDFCYFLLTDYKVPLEIHDKLAKFPPLISKKTVTGIEVSNENKTIKEIKPTSCSTKLCATLEGGQDYLMDFENYLFYCRMGYDIVIKRVFKYEQEYILKKYIDKNSLLRQQSTTAIAKQLYKDLNNICFGKSLESPVKYSNIELLSSERQVKNRIRNPLLKRLEVIVDEKLVLSDLYHAEMQFSTCIQYGFHILEKSKLLMYTSLYEKIVPFCQKYNVDWSLLFHDTDSYMFQFDLHNSIFNNEKEFIMTLHAEENDLFDLHIYTDPEIRDTSRKKKVGYFLDEYSDNFEVIAFVGLSAKSYTYILKDIRVRDSEGNPITKIYDDDKKFKNMKFGDTTTVIKGKGMRNSYLQMLFDYNDFKEISQEGNIKDNKVTFRNIMKKNFGNTIENVTKVALSSFDDKWYIYKENGQHMYLPYGHYKIAEMAEIVEDE